MSGFPKNSIKKDELLNRMREFKKNDISYKDGKNFSLVFYGGEELGSLLRESYNLFMSENALNPSAFPSLRRMENEVVAHLTRHLGGSENSTGSMTSGGTESILLACKTARDYAIATKRIKKPHMIMPETAHPAFDKAAKYFGIELTKIKVKKENNYKVDVKEVAKAIRPDTCLLVGSAPNYVHGVVDPIEDLGQLALQKNVLLHVDACIGGVILPLFRELGREIPPFDFSVPGVTSISVDMHKYGLAAKGASSVLYRNKELRKHQFHVTTDWPGGIYGSPTILGTRPGGAIAACWAVMNYLGDKGYIEMAKKVADATDRFLKGIGELNEIKTTTKAGGQPESSIIAIESDQIDIFQVADEMAEKGWHMDRQMKPSSIHLTVMPAHLDVIDEFFTDMKEVIEIVKSNQTLGEKIKQGFTKGMIKAMPTGMLKKAMSEKTSDLKSGNHKTAPMYGLMGTISKKMDLSDFVIETLDGIFEVEAPKGENQGEML